MSSPSASCASISKSKLLSSNSSSSYFIGPELEKFEKNWHKNFEPEDLNL